MERRFDMTNFEESLRDHVDQFNMIPSGRVWHGIYNDLHPGSKWPSMTMGLIFLFTLLGIGYLNNTPKEVNLHLISEKNESGINAEKQNVAVNSSEQTYFDKHQKQIRDIDKSTFENTIAQKKDDTLNSAAGYSMAKVIPLYPNGINQKDNNPVKNKNSNQINTDDKISKNTVLTAFTNPQNNKLNDQGLQEQKINVTDQKELENTSNSNNNAVIKNSELTFSVINGIPDNLSIFSTGQIEAISIHSDKNLSEEEMKIINNIEAKDEAENKSPGQLHKKRNKKVNWTYFVTPSVSTVSFIGKGFKSNNPTPSLVVTQPLQSENNMIYNARLGYQLGAEMSYAFSKGWKFIAGIDLSYSGYNIISDQIHPIFATLILKDEYNGQPYPQTYMTHYGNGQGENQISLSNYSHQFSLPVGLQYALFENDKIQINLSSTIAPSLVLKSNAYIMSSDGRYYINDPNLLRKLNLSGNFGSFITFKSKKTKWQVGPSVRYQLLSTYQKRYPVKEHLIDYGIRIGISK